MKVSPDYYNEERFHKPEVVERIVSFCNHVERTASTLNMGMDRLVAKRIKSLCLKHYKKNTTRKTVRFCNIWETHPSAMLNWLVLRMAGKPGIIVRIDKTQDFSPFNITIKPLT